LKVKAPKEKRTTIFLTKTIYSNDTATIRTDLLHSACTYRTTIFNNQNSNKMTQQKIKENLPQLPLQTYYEFGNVVDHEGKLIVATDTDDYPAETDSAMDFAIVHAINNTYGKGINPESVSEMYNALKLLAAYFEDGENYDEIQKILNKATL